MAPENGRLRLLAFDKIQQRRIVEAVEAGEDGVKAQERIKEETRGEYLRILTECGDLPVYTLPFPGPDKGPPTAA